ncbi:MAG TPA: hypothetical protein VL948_21400 [Verrucomicrobiae bacterium]|nr:hypothetical protein [Verrucomicrobiae bacterium]
MTTRDLTIEPDPHDFSLVLGGPLFQLARRTHLAGNALELLRRRVIAAVLLTWLPLLALTVLTGRAWGSAVQVPFFKDIEVHARLLVALPLMIIAELVVHQRMRPLVQRFLERDLVAEPSRATFAKSFEAAMRLRNSVLVEVLLLVTIYIGIVFIWPHYGLLHVSTWSSVPRDGRAVLTPAGWWLAYVSVPVFQFMLFRWYFRLFLWIRFLALVSRCQLRLLPTHPDRAGGLGFLANIAFAFAPLLSAHGALLAGFIGARILFQGATLVDFKFELAAVVFFLLLVVVGPLLFFMPQLAAARRTGLREYGTLAQRYVREFDDKWIRGAAPPGEPLIGSADIQSLADLANSYEVVRSMSMVPFTRNTVVQLAVATLLPVAPLLLTMISLDELMKRLLQVVL